MVRVVLRRKPVAIWKETGQLVEKVSDVKRARRIGGFHCHEQRTELAGKRWIIKPCPALDVGLSNLLDGEETLEHCDDEARLVPERTIETARRDSG